MKCYVFLDIDGVLLPHCSEQSYPDLSRSHVATFSKLVSRIGELFEVKLILSSFWRLSRNEEAMTKILVDHGYVGPEVSALTVEPFFKESTEPVRWSNRHLFSSTRADEIMEFLSHEPDEFKFLVIDDDSSPLSTPLKKWFIRTDALLGLQKSQISPIIRKLKGPKTFTKSDFMNKTEF